MATTLNTSNPEYITWEYDQVQVIVLGGLRIEGLDRMRVTLKIQWKEQVVMHLDGGYEYHVALFNSNMEMQFINWTVFTRFMTAGFAFS